MRPVTDVKARATVKSDMRKISQLNIACVEMTTDSEDDTSKLDSEEEELNRRIGISNAYVLGIVAEF